jgi:hypothetical protein
VANHRGDRVGGAHGRMVVLSSEDGLRNFDFR